METVPKVIFLSHSSQDAFLVQALAQQIESVFEPNVRVFASSRPDAIPIGSTWMNKIITNLKQADALVILITRPSENSVWVGFELGYYWKKSNGERIYALNHPTATIPSPLDELQAKLVNDSRQLQDFFQTLSADLHVNYTGNANIEYLVELASLLSVRPPERSLANFENLLKTSEWDKIIFDERDVWICADDVLFQIIIEPSSRKAEVPFDEEWVETFSSGHPARKYNVDLTVAGLPIRQLNFVSLDAGRYFVPMPYFEAASADEPARYFWKRSSLIYQVARRVSKTFPFSKYETLEDIAHAAGIEIID